MSEPSAVQQQHEKDQQSLKEFREWYVRLQSLGKKEFIEEAHRTRGLAPDDRPGADSYHLTGGQDAAQLIAAEAQVRYHLQVLGGIQRHGGGLAAWANVPTQSVDQIIHAHPVKPPEEKA